MTGTVENYIESLAALADQNPVKTTGAKGSEQRRRIAEAALPILIEGRGYSLVDAARLIDHDPEFINGVSTLMGRGNRKDGPRCWTRSGELTACQSNIIKLLKLVSSQFRDEYIGQDGLQEKLATLPVT